MTESNNKISWSLLVVQIILAAILSAGVIVAMLNFFWFEPEKYSREWKQASLEKVVAPVVMNLNRTKIANERYIKSHKFGFAAILYESNKTVRDILLANGHLIPNELVKPASCLVAHYDIWIKRYLETVGDKKYKANDNFEIGFPDLSFEPCSAFPNDDAEKFHDVYRRLRSELHVK